MCIHVKIKGKSGHACFQITRLTLAVQKKNGLEVLRQPMEDGQVTIPRANSTVAYPTKFIGIGIKRPFRREFKSHKPRWPLNHTDTLEKSSDLRGIPFKWYP